MNKINIIEIWWHGPLTMEEIKRDFSDKDSSYGLYQIYGTHNISGPDTLLYIGKAPLQTFAARINQHDWANWEASPTQFYVGQLGGIQNISEKDWKDQIDIAEKLLIYFCAPPYNTHFLNGYGIINDTIILNLDKKNRLPLEVSTFYESKNFWDENGQWKVYTCKS